MTVENVVVNDQFAGVGGSYTYNSGTDSRSLNAYINSFAADVVKVSHKRGDTFTLSAIAADGSGAAVNLTGHTLAPKIKDNAGNVVATPTVTVTSAANGEYDLTVSNTAGWPLGVLYGEVQYTDPQAVVISTETFLIIVSDL